MKNTKELAIALVAIAALLAENFKDGVQVADLGAIFAKISADEVLKAKLVEAYADIELVKEETKEVSAAEVLEVVAALVPEIQALLVAIKK